MDLKSGATRPPLVERALEVARTLGFERSCEDDVGRLLRMLAAAIPQAGVVAEIGTGCGAGTAWIVSGLREGRQLITVESDAERAAAARELLAGYSNATALHADWAVILEHGPFDLVFADAAPAKADPQRILDALKIGGIAVFDDLNGRWPEERQKEDPVRAFWLADPRVVATEIGIDYGPNGYPGSALVATRVR
jgi:predicted O-methyltransferase YrrM